MTMARSRATLAYDPAESLAAFQARQHQAYEHGRQALRERRIKIHLLQLYETFVRCVGANQYTWVGEAHLAEEFDVDLATIKRWIAKLVEAGLIRRQRRFATTSLTFITVYDPAAAINDHESDTQDAAAPDGAAQLEVQGAIDDPGSFAPASAPTFGAKMRRLNLKTDHLRIGGGDSSGSVGTPRPAPEIRRLLNREGVADFFLAPVFYQKSIDELKAVSAYLNRQRNVEDRPKLFAWLVSRDFGAQLLSGREEQRRRKQRPTQANAGQKYLSGELAYLIQGASVEQAEVIAVPPDDPAAHAPPQAEPPTTSVTQTWQQALDQLRQTLPASEFLTWFETSTLVDLDTERAVIGVPNIFARDTLTSCYQAQIAQALHASCGRSVAVQIELEGG